MSEKIPAPNFTAVPNRIFELMPDMKEAELRVTLIIARQTFGWHRRSDKISLSQLMKMAGMSRQGVLNGIEEGMARGTISRRPHGDGFVYSLVVVNEVDQDEDEESTTLTSGGQPSRPVVVNEVDTQNKGKKLKQTTTTPTPPQPAEESAPVAGAASAAGGGGADLKTEAEAYLYRCGVKSKSKRKLIAASLTMERIQQEWTALAALNAQRQAKGLAPLGGGHFADTLEALASAPADSTPPAACLPQKPKAPYLTPEWHTWTDQQRDEATEAYSADLRRYDRAIARAAR